MGWLSNLFKKQEAPSAVTISIEKLPTWFKQQADPLSANYRAAAKAKLQEIQEVIKQTMRALEQLEHAHLRNEQIPDRAKAMMRGNRQSYINFVTIFLSNVKQPKEVNFKQLEEFLENYEHHAAQFTKNTSRNVLVLQEFFKDELQQVGKHLKHVDQIVRDVVSEEYKELFEAGKSLAAFQQLQQKTATTGGLKKEQQKLLRELQTLHQKNLTTQRELQGGSSYQQVQSLREREIQLEREQKLAEEKLSSLLAPLGAALKKYVKLGPGEELIVSEYLESPVTALLGDARLELLDHLKRVEAFITTNTIELKDKKRGKIIDQLRSVTSEKLQELQQSMTGIKQKKQEIKNLISKNATLQQIEELDYRNQHLQRKIDQAEEELKQIESQDQEELIAEELKKLEEALSEVLGKGVKIGQEENKEAS